MKIYFTASTAEFKRYRDDYFRIRNFLVENEHILTRDYLPDTEKRILAGAKDVTDIKQIYKACVNAIKEAELVIIEDTVSNFSTGHQITLALQMKKPTLVLWQGQKYRTFKQMFIHGIDSDVLVVAEYTKENLEEIVREFINKYENISEKNRFHLVLSNPERMYLDWVQFSKGQSRTKVIRESLRAVMNSDKDYSNYLKGKS